MQVHLSGLDFAPDASFVLESDGWTAWDPGRRPRRPARP